MHPAIHGNKKHDPQAEHAGKHHAHDGVLLDPAVARQKARGHGGEHASGKGPKDQGGADQVGQHNAGQDGVADRITHQGPAFQHQKAGQQGRWHRDDD